MCAVAKPGALPEQSRGQVLDSRRVGDLLQAQQKTIMESKNRRPALKIDV
jgi:hypothetical protein